MFYVVELVKDLFGFTRYEFIIATLGILLLLGNFIGGLLYSITLAMGKPRKEYALKDRLSFRMHLLSLLFVVLFAFYYHALLIGKMNISHLAFWGVVLALAPALAYFGVQVTYVIFQKKIEERRKKYREILAKRRAAKAAKMRESTQAAADAKASLERKKKQDAEIDAKIAHARKTHKVGG